MDESTIDILEGIYAEHPIMLIVEERICNPSIVFCMAFVEFTNEFPLSYIEITPDTRFVKLDIFSTATAAPLDTTISTAFLSNNLKKDTALL